MGRQIVVARPGIDETERKMILDTAAGAGYEVIFGSGDELTEEMLSAEILYGEGPAVNAAAARSEVLKDIWHCFPARAGHLA